MKKKSLRRFGGLLLSAVLLLGSLPVCAADDGITAVCDEAYYATTDYYGNLSEGGVVKSYQMNGLTSLTDYGTYDEVINLTDGTEPTAKDGKVSFDFSGKTAPEHFYFEGKTAAPFRALPWTLSVRYTLNGVAARAEELAGKTGVVEISIDAIPNKNAAAYARNNYILMATAIFNQDDILSLKAPGAQVQLVGNLRTVIFVGFPGEEDHFTISVGSNDFSFGGVTFLMMPATLSQLDQIAELSERKDDLEKNYDLLSDSLDTLLDSVSGISGSLYSAADGLDRLEKARGTVSNGKSALYDGTDLVRGDLKSISDLLTPIAERTEKLSKLVTDSRKTVNAMTDAAVDLENALDDLENALDDMEDTGSVTRLRSDLSAMQSALTALKTALTALTASTGSAESYETQLSKIVSLHDIYTTSDFTQFLAKMLVLSGRAANATEAATTAAQLITNILPLSQAQAEAAGQAENWATVQAMKNLYDAKSGMTFEQFCKQVLLSQGAAAESAAETAKTMGEIWTLYSGTDAEGKRDSAALTLLLQNLDSVSETVKSAANALQTPTSGILSSASSLCGNLEKLLKIIDNNDLVGSGKDAVQNAQDILEELDALRRLLNGYEPTLQESLKNLQTASTVSAKTVSDLETLVGDAESLLKSAGTDLDEGTKKTLEGLAASLRATARSLGTTGNVKTAKNNVSTLIEDTWNEYTGEENNMLLMDSTAEAVSLTDSRNAAPQSIQILIRTQEIKAAEADNGEFTKEEAPETTFWQRVGQMFADLWHAITGIFR